MGRRPEYIAADRYNLVKDECRAYIVRAKALSSSKIGDDVAMCYKMLNARFDDAAIAAVGSSYEATVLREDIAMSRGWCKSDLCSCTCVETYIFHKRAFVKAIAAMLGI